MVGGGGNAAGIHWEAAFILAWLRLCCLAYYFSVPVDWLSCPAPKAMTLFF